MRSKTFAGIFLPSMLLQIFFFSFLDRPKILLCSTDDSGTISTWQHLGFHQAQPHELTEWGIAPTELVHMTNTVQMVKHVRERPDWKSIQIRHEGFIQRLYYLRSDHVTSPSKKRKELPSHESTQRKVGSSILEFLS